MSLFHFFYLVPKNWLSYITGKIASSTLPFNLHSYLKIWFVNRYKCEVSEAEFPLDKYQTLRDFFVRTLKEGSRPIADSAVISPVDGTITQKGAFNIDDPELQQVKGKCYQLSKLVGSQYDVSDFKAGCYFTFYLAPYNYHRIHSPVHGRVTRVVHIPGSLWPVNSWSVKNIDGLFVCNERIILHILSGSGSLLLVLVGATNVGKITLDFSREIVGNQPGRREIVTWTPPSPIELNKGEPLGCFDMGSTVILIGDTDICGLCNLSKRIGPGSDSIDDWSTDQKYKIKVGEGLNF